MIDGLDAIIHVPKRLAAMAVLANAPTVSFRFLKEHLQISESDLSKQMSTLESAGYATSTKVGHGRGSSTTYRITKAGQHAYDAHCAALRTLIGDT
ncbi:transcriptional regulator [Micromonospora mirobrigensis]|uniref:Winged helix DNA-binding domain-containing protein n=1 Tax=Micromonospora mirobrigensis TaxID=262898 RepID=A0A1C4YX57_9ACTN|nr:transcriptional regulator [Micromonospora mirobrigensis]SCF25325.1 Winged helix DNA-binding domain-containing protein [Micromonospora mirobrigensis]